MLKENSQKCPVEGVKLTKSLIAQRNLAVPKDKETLENISQALSSLEILRLDRERISHITALEGLEQIHSIYLQQNQIQKIENLSCFPNLKFLSLAGNQISKVENLRSLLKLQFLDLSHNCIKTLDTDELPQSLVVLDLTGNKCTNQNGYRERVMAALPLLKELDTKSTPNQNTPVQSKEEDSSEDSDYEDCSELSCPLSAEKDFFVDLHGEFTSRSARRREEAVREHEAHLEELKQKQKLRELIFDTSHASSKALDRSKQGLPILEDNMLQTEHHTASTPRLRTENSPFSTSAPKEKIENKNQTQLKNPKGEVMSSAKTASKR